LQKNPDERYSARNLLELIKNKKLTAFKQLDLNNASSEKGYPSERKQSMLKNIYLNETMKFV